jgi:hypothetical protein
VSSFSVAIYEGANIISKKQAEIEAGELNIVTKKTQSSDAWFATATECILVASSFFGTRSNDTV